MEQTSQLSQENSNQEQLIDFSNEIQPDKKDPTTYTLGMRTVVGATVITLMIIIQNCLVPNKDVPIILDRMHQLLQGVNDTFRSNKSLLDALLIINGLMLDASTIFITCHFILYGKSVRITLVLIIFYAGRVIHQALYIDPFPKDYYFPFPGMYSLVVTYGRQSDFFYSGHCGFLVIMVVECYTLKFYKLMILESCIFFYTAFLLLSCQVHYTIDILAGAVYAHYFHIIVSKFQDPIDKMGVRLQNNMQRCWNKLVKKINHMKQPQDINVELKV